MGGHLVRRFRRTIRLLGRACTVPQSRRGAVGPYRSWRCQHFLSFAPPHFRTRREELFGRCPVAALHCERRYRGDPQSRPPFHLQWSRVQASQGLTSSNPASSKCFTLRVAKAARRARAIPAIIVSRRSPGLPADLRATMSVAACSAAL